MSGPTPQFDILIVGSGPSGAHAALEAAVSGAKVALLDVGYTDSRIEKLVPDLPFTQLRRSDPNQQQYFLGDNHREGLRSQERAGAHLTPARLHMIRGMEQIFPLRSDSFVPLQSTGLGGLGISWGANCFALEDFELEKIGIAPGELRGYYGSAADEAGVSGRTDDALAPLIANMDHGHIQPPLPLDTNAENLLRRYQRRAGSHAAKGFYLGQSMLAMLSADKGDRRANRLHDMDFWADVGRSVYRPRFTIEKLHAMPNFTHLTGRLAVRFVEEGGAVRVECRVAESTACESFTARKLLLAAGAINSGRLALASAAEYDRRLPILCNVNHWAAMINLGMLGRPARDERHSLSQLTVLMRPPGESDYVLGQIYSYRSLLLFRMLKNIPLPAEQGLRFLRLVATAFTCVNLHFPDYPSADRWIRLERGGETLHAESAFRPEEQARIAAAERRLLLFFARLGCVPLGITRPAHGASLHYVGTLPYSEAAKPFTTAADGRLHGAANVYVADGSTWRFLPAKGLTLTLMANARRTAAAALRALATRGETA